MFQPNTGKLKVFMSGVEDEFGNIKIGLYNELKGRHHLSSYTSEKDKESSFDKNWPQLERQIIDSEMFVLFLGSKFGSPSDEDDNVSITQQEYHTARGLNKPIIVFRKKSNKFENDSQEKFYNDVINFDKDQNWSPTIKNFEDTEELAEKIIKHIYDTAKVAMPALTDEDEAGHFWLKPWIYRFKDDLPDPDNGTIQLKLTIIVQNRDKYSHMITGMWLKKIDSKYEIRAYSEPPNTARLNFDREPLKVLGMDKKIIMVNAIPKVPFDSEKTREEKLQIMNDLLNDIKNAKEFKRDLPLDFKAI